MQVPFGYKPVCLSCGAIPRECGCPAANRRGYRLVPDPEYAPVLQGMVAAFLAGLSLGEIARWLNQTGVPRPSSVTPSCPRLRLAGCWSGASPGHPRLRRTRLVELQVPSPARCAASLPTCPRCSRITSPMATSPPTSGCATSTGRRCSHSSAVRVRLAGQSGPRTISGSSVTGPCSVPTVSRVRNPRRRQCRVLALLRRVRASGDERAATCRRCSAPVYACGLLGAGNLGLGDL